MNKIFSNEQDPHKRAELIQSDAYCTEKSIIKRTYTNDEIQEFKDEYCQLMETFSNVEDELKDLSKPLKEKMKELKERAGLFMVRLKLKYEEISETVYGFPNETDTGGTMDFYDINGEYISSRRLLSNERQFKLKVSSK